MFFCFALSPSAVESAFSGSRLKGSGHGNGPADCHFGGINVVVQLDVHDKCQDDGVRWRPRGGRQEVKGDSAEEQGPDEGGLGAGYPRGPKPADAVSGPDTTSESSSKPELEKPIGPT